MNTAADTSTQLWLKHINGVVSTRNDRAHKYQLKKYAFLVTGNKSYYPIPDSLLITSITCEIAVETHAQPTQALILYPTMAGYIMDLQQPVQLESPAVATAPMPQRVKPKPISAAQQWQVEKQQLQEQYQQQTVEITTLQAQLEDLQQQLTQKQQLWAEQAHSQQKVELSLKHRLETYQQQEHAFIQTAEAQVNLQSQNQTLQEMLQKYQDELQEMRTVMNAQARSLQTTQKELKQLRTSHHQNQEALTAKALDLDEVQQQHQATLQQLEALQLSQSKQTKEFKVLQNNYSVLKNDYHQRQQEWLQHQQQFEHLEQQLKAAQIHLYEQKQVSDHSLFELEQHFQMKRTEWENTFHKKQTEWEQAYQQGQDLLIQAQETVSEQSLRLHMKQQALHETEQSWRQVQDICTQQKQQLAAATAAQQDLQEQLYAINHQLTNAQAAHNVVRIERDLLRQKYNQLQQQHTERDTNLAQVQASYQQLNLATEENQAAQKALTHRIHFLEHTCHQLQDYIHKQKDKIQFRNTQLLQARDTIQRLKQALSHRHQR